MHSGYYVSDQYAVEQRLPRFCPTCGAVHPDDAKLVDGDPVVGHTTECTQTSDGPAYGNPGDVEYGLTSNFEFEKEPATVLVAVKLHDELDKERETLLTMKLTDLASTVADELAQVLGGE